jgi:hypothetical protein
MFNATVIKTSGMAFGWMAISERHGKTSHAGGVHSRRIGRGDRTVRDQSKITQSSIENLAAIGIKTIS